MRRMRDILRYLQEKPANSQYIIQKYIERPMLYHKRKFDIRIWGLINESGLHLYRDGYVRTSSYNYTVEEEKNVHVHLTNNCV